MHTLVWVEGGTVLADGRRFATGERVTWPLGTHLNRAALVETVGPDLAADISMIVCWDPWRPTEPYETVLCSGVVDRIEVCRCRHRRGHVVPNSVQRSVVLAAGGWDAEEDGLSTAGYLVTLSGLQGTGRQGTMRESLGRTSGRTGSRHGSSVPPGWRRPPGSCARLAADVEVPT